MVIQVGSRWLLEAHPLLPPSPPSPHVVASGRWPAPAHSLACRSCDLKSKEYRPIHYRGTQVSLFNITADPVERYDVASLEEAVVEV